MERKKIKIGPDEAGGGAPVYIVFEAGHTHMGFEDAKELIDAAKESGANAIKFQVYDSRRLVSSLDVMDEYEVLVDRETWRREKRREPLLHSLLRHEISLEQWGLLMEYARSSGITFFTTVCFPEEADFLHGLGVDAFKICSGDVDNHPFIRHVAKKGRPVIIDTGSSTIGEVEKAVDVIRAEGNDGIIINHCPTGYPAHIESINLRTISTLRQMFEYPVAFSDHSPGWGMDIAAVALGADMIEKTITFDRTFPEAEHINSVEPEEAFRMVRAIRELEGALGRPRPIWTAQEKEKTLSKRRSIFAREDLEPGSVLTEGLVDLRRPGLGIPAKQMDLVLGRKVKRRVDAGKMLKWEDIQ